MQTFKQFLAEVNSLERVSIEMFFRGMRNFNEEEARLAAEWMLDPESTRMGSEHPVWDLLYAEFGAEMPYDIAKARNDKTSPEEWIYTEVASEIKRHAGVEL